MLDKATAYQLRQASAGTSNKATQYQLGQIQARYDKKASRDTPITPGATELREVGGGNAPFTQQTGYVSQPPMREIGNAGLVRPTNGLGFDPDFVDCPNCQKRRSTVVKKAASETTRYVAVHTSPCPRRFFFVVRMDSR